MRIYKLEIGGEQEWIKANTNIQALLYYTSLTEVELDPDDSIEEVPESKWDERTIKNIDGDEPEYYTLRELAEEETEEVAYLASSIW